jgi:hypothetical protein
VLLLLLPWEMMLRMVATRLDDGISFHSARVVLLLLLPWEMMLRMVATRLDVETSSHSAPIVSSGSTVPPSPYFLV